MEKVYENIPFEEWPAAANSVSVVRHTPVGSVSCECSFFSQRCLKLWNRSTMTEERLSGLEMLLIQRETDYIRTVRGVIHLPNTTDKTGERDLATTRFFLTEFPA